MTSKLKVEFIDNSESQYDENASLLRIGPLPESSTGTAKQGKLFIGDKHAMSFVQLRARDVQAVLCCSGDLFGFCRESGVEYCKVHAEQYSLPDNNNSNSVITPSRGSKKTKTGGKANIGVVGSAAEFVERQLREGKNVVICCESGIRASFLFAAGFLMKALHKSLYESLQMIEKARKCPAKLTLSQCKIALDVEKKLFNRHSMGLEGRQLFPLPEAIGASKANHTSTNKSPSSSAKRESDQQEGNNNNEDKKLVRREGGVSGLTIMLGVGMFFGSLYAAFYAATGKV